MELVTSNSQGELSPLEIGIHALKAVPKSEGGRGKKGGLSEYAEKVGKHRPTVLSWRDAAEVAVNVSVDRQVFLDKATHLAAIHKLPRECWQAACEWLAENEASVADVERKVAQVSQFADTLREWDGFATRRRKTYKSTYRLLQECRGRRCNQKLMY